MFCVSLLCDAIYLFVVGRVGTAVEVFFVSDTVDDIARFTAAAGGKA